MPLRDTLNELREREKRAKEPLQDRAKLIEQWKNDVASLFAEIREDLQEYEKEGSLSFSEEPMRVREEQLGSYQLQMLKVTAGPVVILVQPIGRLVIGAHGRVDMHRQGRAGERQRVMLLRMPTSATDSTPTWRVRMPAEAASNLGRLPQRERIVPLTRETLEQAVEFLLI